MKINLFKKNENKNKILIGHIFSNGDEYEGEWVRGMKQGHGTMKYNDGTIYDVCFPG
jgi:hypothetical protein